MNATPPINVSAQCLNPSTQGMCDTIRRDSGVMTGINAIPSKNLQNILDRRHENRDPMFVHKHCSDDQQTLVTDVGVILGPKGAIEAPTLNTCRRNQWVNNTNLSKWVGELQLMIPVNQSQCVQMKSHFIISHEVALCIQNAQAIFSSEKLVPYCGDTRQGQA